LWKSFFKNPNEAEIGNSEDKGLSQCQPLRLAPIVTRWNSSRCDESGRAERHEMPSAPERRDPVFGRPLNAGEWPQRDHCYLRR